LRTRLVLTFDKPLNPATAQDPRNFKISDSLGNPVHIARVVYNPSALTVTVTPSRRLNLHRLYQLTVIGTAPSGVADTAGNLLDGALNGVPGSNYVATVSAATLAP
jgi:hypothetical protein